VGGTSLSKSSFRLASLAAAGVRPTLGVRENEPCAGLGVTLTKSAKLKFVPGVLGPKPKPAPPMPGVMCEEGKGVALAGGVVGGWMIVLAVDGFGWPGDVAR